MHKAKDQKVILGCESREELAKVRKRIEQSEAKLKMEDIKNKDPLVILKNVMAYNTNEEMVAALKNQNASIFKEMEKEEQKLEIKYRKRARNPLTTHIVMQVAPQM